MLYAEHKCHRLSQNSKEWKSEKLDAKDVLPNINCMQATKGPKMQFLSLVTFTFKLVRARNQTRLPCEFGANLFSGSRDISYINKKTQTDGAKNRTRHSSLYVVITIAAATAPTVPCMLHYRWKDTANNRQVTVLRNCSLSTITETDSNTSNVFACMENSQSRYEQLVEVSPHIIAVKYKHSGGLWRT